MKQIVVLFIVFFIALKANSQNMTSSPYSMYGIGELEGNKSGQSVAMGGAGIAFSNPGTLNNINPASYYSIDSLSVLFNFGVQSKQSIYTNHGIIQSGNDFNFSSIALGFRISRWWANSIGITPFSSVGYKINTTKSIEGWDHSFDAQVEGSGGINRFYWGNSFKLTKNFYVGMNISYLFGQIDQKELSTSYLYNGILSYEDNIDIRDWVFDFGMQYTFLKKEDLKGTFGATFSNKTNLKLQHHIDALDNTSDTLFSNKVSSGIYTMPTILGFGTSFEINRRYTLSADYKIELWSNTGNTAENVHYMNSNEFRFGAEYLPLYSVTASYFNRIRYRIGGFYKSSYLKIKGDQLRDYGFSIGLGLPINRMQVNLAYVYGFNGAFENSGIINQKYHLIALTLSLHELWFTKLKYD